MALRRLWDWQTRADRFLRQVNKMPFAFGTHDCSMFATNMVREITGEDVVKAIRGLYKTEQEAKDIIDQLTKGQGLEQLADQIARQFGLEQISVLRAQRCDVVLINVESNPALGIVSMDGRHILVAAARGGVIRYPLKDAIKAWRIG